MSKEKSAMEQLISDLKVCSDKNLPCRRCSRKPDGINCAVVLMRDAAKALATILEESDHEE